MQTRYYTQDVNEILRALADVSEAVERISGDRCTLDYFAQITTECGVECAKVISTGRTGDLVWGTAQEARRRVREHLPPLTDTEAEELAKDFFFRP